MLKYDDHYQVHKRQATNSTKTTINHTPKERTPDLNEANQITAETEYIHSTLTAIQTESSSTAPIRKGKGPFTHKVRGQHTEKEMNAK